MKKIVKKLKFASPLISLIENGQKTSTWRLFDDKNLTKGDVFEILEQGSNASHGFARIIDIKEKMLGSLTAEDKKGHESFKDDETMYKTYENYYRKTITPQTIIKIIRFTLLP